MRFGGMHCVLCVLIAIVVAAPIGVLGGSAFSNETQSKQWTILMYWDADNSLEFCTEFAMKTWEQSLPTNVNVNIVALVDLLSSDGIWIYDIVDGKRQLIDTWDEMKTSDPATLEQFIAYGMENFPAAKTMLVLQDHGYGWRGICEDETNGDTLMSIHGVASALMDVKKETGKGVDLLAFDACNMMSIEGIYELRDAVPYVVGSETTVPFDGLPYMMFISDLIETPSLSPASLAKNIVHEYVQYYSSKWDYAHIMRYSQDFATMSAFDMSKVSALGDSFVTLTRALMPIVREHKGQIGGARGYSLMGTWSNMAGYEWSPDLYAFVEGLKGVRGHPELLAAISNFETAFNAALLAEDHSGRHYDAVHGLNFCFPPSLSQYNMNSYPWLSQFVYDRVGLDLVTESSWADCLMAYYHAK